MKTVKQIEYVIKDIKKQMSGISGVPDKEEKKRYKLLSKDLELAMVCELYLRTEPTSEFVGKEKDRVQNRISAISDNYVPPDNHEKMLRKELTKHRGAYEKEYQVPKLKAQLKFLKYILS